MRFPHTQRTARSTPATTLLAAGVLSLLFVSAGRTQDAATGVVTGRATDASGAALAGVRVVATRAATATVREATTDTAGRYTLASLAPGEYRVVFEAPGFAPKALDHVVVEVGRRVPADAVLDVFGRAEAVTVEEHAVPLATGSSLVGGVVGAGVVENLPLNGRNFLELAFLLPGNAPAPNFDPTKANVIAISAAGQLGRGGNITIDGQDNNDDVVGGPLANLPQDAIQEFQMATNRFSAEQGRSAAAAVNVVTRGGSDTLSGSASFLLRDDALQGLPATYDRSTGEAPPFSRQQYSATLGGPIVRGKAWWFAAAEYSNQDAVVQAGERDLATRTHPPDAGRGAARRLPGPGARRRAGLRQGHARRALPDAGRAGHGREHARPLDRLGFATPGEREPPPPGPRDLDARHGRLRRQHAARELQRLQELDRARDARAASSPSRASRTGPASGCRRARRRSAGSSPTRCRG